MRSLRARLWVLWAMAASASVGVAVLLVQLYLQSAAAQASRAEALVASACGGIRSRYAFYVRGWDGAGASFDDPGLRRDLAAVVAIALAESEGLAGGIWQADAGSLATVGLDAARMEKLPAIEEANRVAQREDQAVARTATSPTGEVVLAACPLDTPLAGVTAWAMTLVPSNLGFDRLRLGLGLLLFLVLGMSAWLSRLILLWSRHVGGIEATLAHHDSQAVPVLARTGERELDRIVDALNEAGRRLAEGRRRAEELATRVAASERMAALGRVAAGVAHEIRNPIASMQLKAENALAGDDARRRQALEGMLGQIARLDTLVSELLAFTQPRQAHPRVVDVAGFLTARAAEQREAAEVEKITLDTRAEIATARFDPELVARVLDNLVRNAIQHAGHGARVSVRAAALDDTLRFTVADSGPGIQAALRETLFEPFVTGRAEGTGLGLAIAREFAEAHGGRLMLVNPGGERAGEGAVFAMELPWLSS